VATRRSSPSPLLAIALVLLALACAGLAFGPRLVDGYLALQWTRHYVGRNLAAPRVADARPTGRSAARAVDGLAPLPQAWEAARLALEYGERLKLKDAAAARAVLTPVRVAVERAVASRLRGLGLGELRELFARAEDSLLVVDPRGEADR
jgi:hypothetical protein